MPHNLRKTRKRRGSRTCGWGRVGQHRRTGSKGHRNPGRHKGSWSYVIKYEPDYYGKNGFTSPKSLKTVTNTINVEKLEILAEQLSTNKESDRPIIDLNYLGYTKLLGTGKITRPLIVKVRSCSKSAADKVDKAGGQVSVITQGTEE
nr:large subunit ribosomal protein L15 [uncultured archaeon]